MENDSLKKKHKAKHPARYIILGFISVILVGATLLILPFSHKDGKWFSIVDAIFTATSAVCVTGLAVVDTATHFTLFGQIVILLLIQIGGLGFMTMASIVFFVVGKRFTLRDKLILKEATSSEIKDVLSFIKKIVVYALTIEAVGAILLSFGFVPKYGWINGLYKAIFHSVSAFCNAGFDVLSTSDAMFVSLSQFSSAVMVILPIAMLIIAGGIGFAVFDDVRKAKKWSKLTVYSKLVLSITGVFLISGTVLFFIFEYNNAFKTMNFCEKLMNAFFQSVTPRTAGFSVVDQSTLTAPSRALTMFFMFIGASPASTGGGIKTVTFFLILVSCIYSFKDSDDTVFLKHSIAPKIAMKSFVIFFISFAIVSILTFVISISEKSVGNDISLESILFEAISAFGTVGLSYGITPSLSPISKIGLIIVMFIGRLGPFTIGSAMINGNHNKKINIKYKEAKLIIG